MIAVLRDPGHVMVAFPTQEEAEAAVDELRALGMADPQLVRVMHRTKPFEDAIQRRVFRAMRHGMMMGIPLCIVAVTALMFIAAAGSITLVQALGVGIWGGAIAGLFVGGLAGMLTVCPSIDRDAHWSAMYVPGPRVLVVARPHGRADDVQRILDGHGAHAIPERQAA